jgi:hypothetical protein
VDPKAVPEWGRQATVLRNAYMPGLLRSALGLDHKACIPAVRNFFLGFRDEAGWPDDPVENLLLDQLLLAHLKLSEMYGKGAEALTLETEQHYGTAAARLLGAVCQLVTTLAAYRASDRPRHGYKEVEAPAPAQPPPRCGPEVGPTGARKSHTQKVSNGTRGRR